GGGHREGDPQPGQPGTIHDCLLPGPRRHYIVLGPPAAFVVASLTQVSRRRTRIPLRLVQRQHVDRERDSNDGTIALELTPRAISARFRHVALERDGRAARRRRGTGLLERM